MKRKVIVKLSLILLFCYMLTSCLSPWRDEAEMGAITISFSGNTRAAAWPPTNENGALQILEHRITLRGPTGTENHILSPGELSGNYIVEPGLWNITIEAWWNDDLFGTGSGRVEVIAGETNSLNINMQRTEHTFFIVANAANWAATVAAIRNGGSNNKYIINVTRDINGVSGSEDLTFGEASGIHITIRGNHKITLAGTGSLLRIGAGQEVVIEDLTLAGQGGAVLNYASLVTVEGGIFAMQGSASVSDNFTDSSGGGIYVADGAVFTMYSGTITNNTAGFLSGGGVSISGIFNMKGGSIIDNNIGRMIQSNIVNYSTEDVFIGKAVADRLTLSGNAVIGTLKLNADNTGNFSNVAIGANWTGSVTRLHLLGSHENLAMVLNWWVDKQVLTGAGRALTAADVAKFTLGNFYDAAWRYLSIKSEQFSLNFGTDTGRLVSIAKQEGINFLAENGNRPEVEITSSGLQYEVINETGGQKPLAADMVRINFESWFINNTILDPYIVNFDIIINQFIPGFTEGLQLMGEGSTYIFYFPYDLAYGAAGFRQPFPPHTEMVPPFTVLIYKIELLQIY
jgi:hypothetical protein